MQEEVEELHIAIDKIERSSTPIMFVKKALSSLPILLLIGLGMVINWIFALIFLFSYFSSLSFFWFIIGLLFLAVIFPAIYAYSAYSYGQSIIIWEVYQEAIRPITKKLISGTLDKFLVDKPNGVEVPVDKKEIEEAFEAKKESILDKLPEFIAAYFRPFLTGKDMVTAIIEQRKTGIASAEVKDKISSNVFSMLDTHMENLAQPSLSNFYIAGVINIIIIGFLFF